MVNAKSTEIKKKQFYDYEVSLYQSIGKSETNIRWGYFTDLATASIMDFVPACQHWQEYMLQQSGITSQSKVLDIGCGEGDTAIWLAQQIGCTVVGIDTNSSNIEKAQNKAQNYPTLSLDFQIVSANNLPFTDSEFSHVWSHATLYRINDRIQALQEIHRVLKEAGTFIFDDLLTPVTEVSETTREQVYDRLSLSTTFSPDSYAKKLNQLGLMVAETKDVSLHLHKSYQLLAQQALSEYPDLNVAYTQICNAIEKQELSWSFYVCKKITDRLTWIHDNKDTQELESKYNAWATLYESDIGDTWQIMPQNAANLLKQLLPQEDIAILDAGAGSGMVGEALVNQNYSNITAVDLSTEMLEIAKSKQVYKQLRQANLEKPLTFLEQESFDAILGIGLFTYGHASPAGLYNLLPLLKHGGIFILTVRLSNKPMQEAFTKLPWSLISQQEYMFEGAPFHILAYRKD